MTTFRFTYDDILEKLFLIYFCVMFCHQSIPGLKGILFMVIIGLTIIKLIMTKRIPKKMPYVILWYLFVFILSYTSQIWAISSHSNVNTILDTMIRIFIIVLCMSLYATTSEKAQRLYRIYYLSCIYFSIILLVTSPLSTYGSSEFTGITGQWKTFIGQIMVFAIILALYYNQKGYKGSKYCIILFSITILATGSVKGVSGIFFVFLLFGLFFYKLKKKFKFFIIIGLLTIIVWNVVTSIPAFNDVFSTRIENILLGEDESGFERSYFVVYGLEISKEHNILGYGVDGFAESLREIGYSNPTYSHNNWIEILVCYGIVGIFIYYSGYIYCIFQSIKNIKNPISRISIIIMITFMVYEIWFISHYMYMYIFLIAINMLNVIQVNKDNINIRRRYIDVKND